MPAEWEPHTSTWLTWPRPASISFPGRYDIVPPILAKLVRLIAEGESVHINIWDADLEHLAKRSLEDEGVTLAKVPTPRPVVCRARNRRARNRQLGL